MVLLLLLVLAIVIFGLGATLKAVIIWFLIIPLAIYAVVALTSGRRG